MTMLQTEHDDAELWLSTGHQEDAWARKCSEYFLQNRAQAPCTKFLSHTDVNRIIIS